MKRVGLLVLVAAIVVACGPPPGRQFEMSLVYPDGSYALDVKLGDKTELVAGIEAGPQEPWPPGQQSIRSDPADPMALILTWEGGACEHETDIAVWPEGDRYNIAISSMTSLFASCPAIGLLRAIRIKTSKPVAIDQIHLVDLSSPNAGT